MKNIKASASLLWMGAYALLLLVLSGCTLLTKTGAINQRENIYLDSQSEAHPRLLQEGSFSRYPVAPARSDEIKAPSAAQANMHDPNGRVGVVFVPMRMETQNYRIYQASQRAKLGHDQHGQTMLEVHRPSSDVKETMVRAFGGTPAVNPSDEPSAWAQTNRIEYLWVDGVLVRLQSYQHITYLTLEGQADARENQALGERLFRHFLNNQG